MVRMKSIGFADRSVVYACLAETIVLALEGRFENFTLGRNLEWEKVHELDPNYKDVKKNLAKARILNERLESIKKSKAEENKN